ncbi:hypothetical protein HY256_05440 [Candidatus Sumerlaeota bacterium]|nr:hypothetical protein [Candidatus Sumerlaeota bacterium]
MLNSDVLFHPALLPRLIADERENVLLADFREGMGEEEMKIVVDASHRLRHVSKVIDPHKAHAENLGVLKLGQTAAHRMIQLARSRGRDPKIRWVPDGIHFLRDELEFYALPIGELPWTEIDYLHDLDRAEREIYPRIAGALWG